MVKGIGKFSGVLKKQFTIGTFSYSVNGDKAVIWECSPDLAGDVIIPREIDGYPVEVISGFAFLGCTKIKSVTLPDTVKKIEYNAFDNCASLEKINLPEGLEKIGKEAFYNCEKLEQIKVPSSVKQIGDYAFAGCSSLTRVELPTGMTELPEGIFSWCSGLKEIALPSSIKQIEMLTFNRCYSLKTITLPGKLESIGFAAFRECSSLNLIDFPSTLKTIEHSAFEECKTLSEVTLPKGLTKIESDTFFGCSNLKTIILPNQLECIGARAFYECIALNQINVPNSLRQIDNYAFYNCASLNSSALSSKISLLGKDVFTIQEETNRESIDGSYSHLDESYYTYDGKEKKPKVLIYNLTEGKDYRLSYEYNRNAGHGIAVLEGVGKYVGVHRLEFEIVRADLYDVVDNVVFSPSSFTYDGNQKKPKVTISGLKENVDFIVTGYGNNVEPGYGLVCIDGIGNYTGDLVMDFPIKLNTPVVSLDADNATGKPVLSWKSVHEAEEFEIYRKTEGQSSYKLIKVIEAYEDEVFSFCDKNAETGIKYYYKIRAASFCGDSDSDDVVVRSKQNTTQNEKGELKIVSGYSKVKSIVCNLPRTTVSITTVKSSGKPKLTWKKSLNADSYAVYRSMTKNGRYTKIYTTKKTSYVNTNAKVGKKYYYKVKALYSANPNANSAFSLKKSITCDCARPVVSIKLSKKGKPKLSWKTVKGASKYEIWRSTAKNGKYKKIYTTKKVTYTNLKAKKGKVYYYKVRAINGMTKNANSAYSFKKWIKTKK